MSLKNRILLGFLAILIALVTSLGWSTWQLSGVRDDLLLIHRGFLTMSRLALQVRTLQEAKDEYVARALTDDDPAVRRHLVAYARAFYPKAIRDRLSELETITRSLRVDENDQAAVRVLIDQIESARVIHDAYDEATVLLLDRLVGESTEGSDALVENYRSRGVSLSEELRALSVRVDAKLSEVVLASERTARSATLSLVVVAAFSILIGALVMLFVQRGLRPLQALLNSVRAIGRGSLDVEVPLGGSGEVSALATEFNTMARGLKDRERALAAQNEDLVRLRAFSDDVIRSVRVGIIVIDDHDMILRLNPAARSVFSLPLIDVENRKITDVESLTESLSPALRALGDVRDAGVERAFPQQTLGHRIVDVALVPIRDAAGVSGGLMLLIGEDVTAREEARGRLVESERLAAIGRLAAQITHEIRNPLSSIGLNVELLSDDLPHLPDDRRTETRAILDAVAKEVDRLTLITEGYLRYARLPAPRHEDGDVGDVVADLAAFSQSEAERMGVMLELQVEEGLPSVPHDPARLRQALLNLLRNAEEAAGRGGTVRLSARQHLRGVRIAVEDSGPGLDDEARARVFEPFFTTKSDGTGLGLTLTREIVRAHGGDLQIIESILGGAGFAIDLPLDDNDDDGAPAPVPHLPPS